MEEAMQTKDAVRRQMRARRKALTSEERERAAKAVCARLSDDGDIMDAVDPFYCDEKCAVAVYLASPDEIDLSDFILELLRRKATVVAPRWNGETYELARVKSLSDADLRRGPMNILEPAETDIVKPEEIGVWIVPGLAFTKRGNRLGYGGGWYDRLLAMASKSARKIGVAHKFQIVENLPNEPHDIKMDAVVTDTLSDRHLDFTETPDGFRASVTVDSLPTRRALFIISFFGLCMFPVVILVGWSWGKSIISMPLWTCLAVIVAMTVVILASVVAMLRILGGPEAAEIEVIGEKGICRRRLLGLFQRRIIHFHWSPFSRAYPFGSCFYSTSKADAVSVQEGNVWQPLFKTYGNAASVLALRMNLAHHVDSAIRSAAADEVLAALPKGMRIVRDEMSEAMEVRVSSLAGIGDTIGCCGTLGIFATLLASFLTRWPAVFAVSMLLFWSIMILAVLYHAHWTLFGRHRLKITGANCEYETRLGPRVKRQAFTLDNDSHVTSYLRQLRIVSADGEHHYCFNDLPNRCYLPLVLFVEKHIPK